MANEILKDEILKDEQLDRVTGSSCYETANDSRFLNILLQGRTKQCNRYGANKILFSLGMKLGEIDDAWESVGIKAKLNYSTGSNKYYLGGKEISNNEAWAHAEKVVGKHLNRSDWDW